MMADQIDIIPLTGRRLQGFIAGKPMLGDEDHNAPVNAILFNGKEIGTSNKTATAALFLTRADGLSPADVYAIQLALAKHHKTTKTKKAIRPFNHGHQPKRIISEDMRASIQAGYDRRRRLLSQIANRA